MTKNPFFKIALNRASRLLGKKGRLLLLLTQLGQKMRGVQWKEVKAADIREKFFVLGRLLKAYANGTYRDIPWKTVILITAAVIYFISPLDLIPDLIPGLGFTDDFGILISVYTAVVNEIDKFIRWEKSHINLS